MLLKNGADAMNIEMFPLHELRVGKATTIFYRQAYL